jgi:hypothetical protein
MLPHAHIWEVSNAIELPLPTTMVMARGNYIVMKGDMEFISQYMVSSLKKIPIWSSILVHSFSSSLPIRNLT